MKIQWLTMPLWLVGGTLAASADAAWTKFAVTSDFLTEGAACGDLNGDGKTDLVAGAFWFKGPEFRERVRFQPGGPVPPTAYQEDSFLSWVDDVNGDGKNDILMASHPGKNLTLFINPGAGADGNWPSHVVMTQAASECPLWADLEGDGRKEIVCMQGGKFGFARPDLTDATKPWNFTAISDKRSDSPYVHGLGVGDLSGDGRPDIVAKDGWFEQPSAADGRWDWHPVAFAGPGGSQMLVFDADGDGDNDLVTSLDAHGYGLAWYESVKSSEGKVTFKRHDILPEDPAKSGEGGLQFSQLHSLASADFDGDGRIDFVTGKRYLAHNGNDPGAKGPAVTVIFFNRKDGDGVHWQPQMIANDTGAGCQILATDLNGDNLPEVIVGNKKGVAVLQKTQ